MDKRVLSPEEAHNVMSVPNIQECVLGVTTITAINKLKSIDDNGVEIPCKLNQAVAFTFLPYKTIELAVPRRHSKRVKLKNVDFEVPIGTILSVRFEGHTRGLVRSRSQGFLKNSVSIDMVVERNKHVNVKITTAKEDTAKLHMCGPRNQEHIRICSTHVMNYLYQINDMVEYVRSHPEEAEKAYQWAVDNCKGDAVEHPVYRKQYYMYEKKPIGGTNRITHRDVIFQEHEDSETVSINMKVSDIRVMERSNWTRTSNINGVDMTVIEVDVVKSTYTDYEIAMLNESDIPDNIDKRCVDYFTFNANRGWNKDRESDYKYYSLLLGEMNWLREYNGIYTHKPMLGTFPRAMTNHNFGLGYAVNRFKVVDLFSKHPDFGLEFDNMRGQNIKITVPYYSNSDDIHRKNASSSITFILYRTGRVTLTGPTSDLNMLAFYKLIAFIKTIEDEIKA